MRLRFEPLTRETLMVDLAGDEQLGAAVREAASRAR
jgi:hypothetical protein